MKEMVIGVFCAVEEIVGLIHITYCQNLFFQN
jgi:hypothetical protein